MDKLDEYFIGMVAVPSGYSHVELVAQWTGAAHRLYKAKEAVIGEYPFFPIEAGYRIHATLCDAFLFEGLTDNTRLSMESLANECVRNLWRTGELRWSEAESRFVYAPLNKEPNQ